MALVSARYGFDALLGQVFIGTTAVGGVVLPAFSVTAAVFSVWNPLGSNKNIYLLYCTIGYVSGTAAAGNFALGFQTGVGANVATGGPVTAATLVAPQNGYLGAGNASIARFAPATLTLGAAPSYLMTLGTSQLVTTAATTSGSFFQSYTDFQGAVVLPPGTLIVVGGNIASSTTADVTMVWEEV